MPTHTEREHKYELRPDAKLPSLERISGVVAAMGPNPQRLEAVYYDTPNLRLARAGVTLRRRSGGPDAGWHLKVPADSDTRTEIRFPLSAGTTAPPAELTAMTLGQTRRMDLVPVARIVTDRAGWRLVDGGGTSLADVADDRVAAQNLLDCSAVRTWREVEFELAEDADVALLARADKALRKAGLRRSDHDSMLARVLGTDTGDVGASAGDHLIDYLRDQVDTLVRNDLLARRDTEDAVHQMRVAIRRIRGSLRVYRRLLDPDRVRRVRAELSWLAGRLAAARDLEVMEEHCHGAVRALAQELVIGPVAARLTRHFAPARAEARRAVSRTLNSKRYLRLLDELDRMVADPPLRKRAHRAARAELPRHIGKACRKVAGRVRDLDTTPEADGALHSARKAAKRLRYAAEVAVPAIGKPANRTRKRAKAITKALGTHQDSVVARPVLRELGIQAQLAGENAFTFGLLYGLEAGRATAARERFVATWRRASTKRVRSWLR